MLAAGDELDALSEGYPWLEREDILACLVHAHRLIRHEGVESASLAPPGAADRMMPANHR